MYLQALFDELVVRDLIPSSRKGPAKTAIKQFAAMLGYEDPARCPVEAFNLPAALRKSIIDTRARRTYKDRKHKRTYLGARAVINIKNNVSYVLKKALELDLIPLSGALKSWKESNKVRNMTPPDGKTYFSPGDTGYKPLPRYGFTPTTVPDRLADELAKYRLWTTQVYNPQRPERLTRREVSANIVDEHLRTVAGFLANVRGLDKDSLDLWSLAQPEHADWYAEWFVKRHGRATKTIWQRIVAMRSVADYLRLSAPTQEERDKAATLVLGIKSVQGRIPRLEVVRDKRLRWLSLEQLDSVAQSLYPLNPRRMSEVAKKHNWWLKIALEKGGVRHYSFKRTAVWAEQSLLIRWMVRLPLRQRNFREMCWNPPDPEHGKNLYREGNKWFVRFSNKELKIGFRKGKVNSISHQVPQEICHLLEEYLTKWRPLLTGIPYSFEHAARAAYEESSMTKAPAYKKAPGNYLVFLNELGAPVRDASMTVWIEKATYKFTGVAVNPHLIRDIWATTYIKRTKDFIGAAKRLGDLVETVLKHYAHLLDDDAEESATAFNDLVFGINPGGVLSMAKSSETAQGILQLFNVKKKLLKTGLSEDEIVGLLRAA